MACPLFKITRGSCHAIENARKRVIYAWDMLCNTNFGKLTQIVADQESRLRGARRDIVYINEANNITFDAYYQLAIRTNLEVWIDYNPTAEFWAHTQVLTDKDAELLILTYKDNLLIQ